MAAETVTMTETTVETLPMLLRTRLDEEGKIVDLRLELIEQLRESLQAFRKAINEEIPSQVIVDVSTLMADADSFMSMVLERIFEVKDNLEIFQHSRNWGRLTEWLSRRDQLFTNDELKVLEDLNHRFAELRGQIENAFNSAKAKETWSHALALIGGVCVGLAVLTGIGAGVAAIAGASAKALGIASMVTATVGVSSLVVSIWLEPSAIRNLFSRAQTITTHLVSLNRDLRRLRTQVSNFRTLDNTEIELINKKINEMIIRCDEIIKTIESI